jgi:hypothetical protein|tara:strand:+ start:194 stop:379 length:186 start_codon:yes stop_codon:yes gene_type:complete
MSTSPLERAVDNYVDRLSIDELKEQKFNDTLKHYEELMRSSNPMDVLEAQRFMFNHCLKAS